MTSTGLVSSESKLNSDFSSTGGSGMSEGSRATVVRAMPKLAWASTSGMMCLVIVEEMCEARVRVS